MILNAAGKPMRRTAGFVSTLEQADQCDVATGVGPRSASLDVGWIGMGRQWRREEVAAVREDDPR